MFQILTLNLCLCIQNEINILYKTTIKYLHFSDCLEGFYGGNCSQRCSAPTYGKACQFLCQNCTVDVYDHVHGYPPSELGKYKSIIYAFFSYSITNYYIL